MFVENEILFEGGDLFSVRGNDGIAFFDGLDLHGGYVHVGEDEEGLLFGSGGVFVFGDFSDELFQGVGSVGAVVLPLGFEFVVGFEGGLEFGLEGVSFCFGVVELEMSVFELLPEILVFEFKIVDFLLKEGVIILEVGKFVGFDGEGLV